MEEILKLLNDLSAEELDRVILRAGIMLEKKKKEEQEQKRLDEERQRLLLIEKERQRQEEIAALQRKLSELQNQQVDIPDQLQGDNFVMRNPAATPRPTAVPTPPVQTPNPQPPVQAPNPQPPKQTLCPHCHQPVTAGSVFCEHCGQRLSQPPQPKPAAPQPPRQVLCPHCRQPVAATDVFCGNCGKRIDQPPQANPQPKPAQPVQAAGQVRYVDGTMKEWNKIPGENPIRNCHEIKLLDPEPDKKYAYYMEITDKRILLSRQSAKAKNARNAIGIGGGLIGSLIAEAAMGDKMAILPWVEIPLSAVTRYGMRDKKEFYFQADRNYVMKDHKYEAALDQLIPGAKR